MLITVSLRHDRLHLDGGQMHCGQYVTRLIHKDLAAIVNVKLAKHVAEVVRQFTKGTCAPHNLVGSEMLTGTSCEPLIFRQSTSDYRRLRRLSSRCASYQTGVLITQG